MNHNVQVAPTHSESSKPLVYLCDDRNIAPPIAISVTNSQHDLQLTEWITQIRSSTLYKARCKPIPPSQDHRTDIPLKLREATLIVPQTGARVKRKVTLRDPAWSRGLSCDGPSDEHTPLLAQRSSSHHSTQIALAKANQTWAFLSSRTAADVLKCSLAYLFASMATFLLPIAALLGQQDGKHVVATVAVLFHPARSRGSMYEAIVLAHLAFVYAAVVAFSSMAVSMAFANRDLTVVGQTVVLIVFCGGGLGFTGWLKQRLQNQLVNVACSMAALAIISVLTREGAVQIASFSYAKVVQVLKMVIMGILFSTLVCLFVKPISANSRLRESMIEATDCIGDMLAMITRSFLSGSEEQMHSPSFTNVAKRYKAVLVSLKTDLREAGFEHYVSGTEKEHEIEARLVTCMQRLAHNIGGLRSAATTQFSLLEQSDAGSLFRPSTAIRYFHDHHEDDDDDDSLSTSYADAIASTFDNTLAPIDEVSEEGTEHGERANEERDSRSQISSEDPIPLAVEVFAQFIKYLGPSMKAFTYALKRMLDDLPFAHGPEFHIILNERFRSSLVDAIELYSNARQEALRMLYRDKEFNKARTTEITADFEEVAASCGHFSYSLQHFAEELRIYLEILDELKEEVEHHPRQRSWGWLFFWRKSIASKGEDPSGDPGMINLLLSDESPATVFIVTTAKDDAILFTSLSHMLGPGTLNHDDGFKLKKATERETFRSRLWKALGVFRRDDTKFAIKVGAGAAIYALPSFLSSTRTYYSKWRGEW
ncbi:MAG: hypothetical protein M1816_001730 [Peltula sp. TS41687]|nr:MAG: hypothetical protein M1816_001730 [Peltula sp. TS41687]